MINLSIRRLSEKEFLEVKHEWNSVLEKSVTNEVFLLWEWTYAWWNSFKDGDRELYILIGEDSQGKMVGIAPFYKEKEAFPGMTNRGVLKFCSSSDTYPDHLDIICEKEYADPFLESICEYLKRNGKDWTVIKLDGVGENSFVREYFERRREDIKGFLVDCIPDSECPYLSLRKEFEEYLKSFPRKKRYNLLREKRKLLEKEGIKLKSIHLGEEPEKDIKNLFLLHAERAERKGIETTFCGEKIYDFHKTFIASLLKEGKIIILSVYAGSVALASSYCMKHNNKYYYYQSGISSEGERKSAGAVLLSLLIEQASGEGCNELDFLRGREDYKDYWTENYRKNYSITVRKDDFRNRMTHYIYAFYRHNLAQFQRIYKPIIGRTNKKGKG